MLDVVGRQGGGVVLAVRSLLLMQATAFIKGISFGMDQPLPILLEADGAEMFI